MICRFRVAVQSPSCIVQYPAGEAPWSVAVGDFNGDGHADLVVANNGGSRIMFGLNPWLASGTLSVLLGNGDGTFQAAPTYPGANGLSVAVKDFNGDGISDLAVVFEAGSACSWARETGRSRQLRLVTSPGPAPGVLRQVILTAMACPTSPWRTR